MGNWILLFFIYIWQQLNQKEAWQKDDTKWKRNFEREICLTRIFNQAKQQTMNTKQKMYLKHKIKT